MRNKFDEQLDKLNVELIEMGALCEDIIKAAGDVIDHHNMELISEIASMENEINQCEYDIEGRCMKLLLRQQPVARDLRVISAALKMVSDLERIGDQAGDIAALVDERKNVVNVVDHHTHLIKMSTATIDMVTRSIDSFVKKDLDAAREVIKSDDIVDDLFTRVKEEVIGLIHDDSSKGEECVDILMIAKYYERIGDHASNIAEWVEYSITGEYKGGSL